ncbi:MAG: sodium:solute symporter family protein [candidate division Zixibacteria bacterium]|nr:sodium:solute symporter family protein [candidate division Zixibacteria bacterium]
MNDRLILWTIVIGYMLFVFVKGVMKVKKINTTDDYLVAGRNVNWFLLFCTMGATVIGGGYSIGAIGKTYEWGILMLLVSTGGYLHFIFSGLVVAPQFREAKLYTVAGYFGHRFGEGPRFLVLILSLLFSVFIVAAQMAAFGTVTAAILPDLAGAQEMLRWAILIGGIMVVTYSTAGGLMAVIHTDLFQFIVLMVGFIITLAFCIPDISDSYNPDTGKFVPSRFGVVDIRQPAEFAIQLSQSPEPLSVHIRAKLDSEHLAAIEQVASGEDTTMHGKWAMVAALNSLLDNPDFYDSAVFAEVNFVEQTKKRLSNRIELDGRDLRRLNLSLLQDAFQDEISRDREISADFFKVEGGKGWLFLLTTFLAFLLGETFAPGYATRYCVGKNIRETKLGIAGVGFFLALTFPVILFFIALFARIQFPDIDPQQALPMVIDQLHNPVIGGLMIGALLMAVMSSADSALNSSTAIFVKDLFEHQLGWKDNGDGRMLKLARICTAGLGVSAILVAILWSDIIGLLLFTYHVWAPAIILPVIIGALWKKRSATLTKHIFITMLSATILTLMYRGISMLKSQFDIIFFDDNTYSLIESFDPAVFGVLISCIVFMLLRLFSRFGKQGANTTKS